MENNNNKTEKLMTVGEIAKKMGVTVRTLQYYHKENIIEPSAMSEGGRRQYTNKDLIKLHLVLSMKSLGFSLSEIKNKILLLNTPNEVAEALERQAAFIREKLTNLNKSLKEVETLKKEVLQMQEVDFQKYADIVVNLQMKNNYYGLIKYFDDSVLDYVHEKFNPQSGKAFMEKFNDAWKEAINLHELRVLPSSETGQKFAKKFWNLILEFSGGDELIIRKLMESANKIDENDEQILKDKDKVIGFMEPALGAYFQSLNLDNIKE